MPKNNQFEFIMPSFIGVWDKVYHWTYNRKRRLSLHSGSGDKCRRVHYNKEGQKK